MRDIGWFHISDLHFGVEQTYTTIKEIRRNLIPYITDHKSNFPSIKYLFISGDIISCKEIDKIKRIHKQNIIKPAIDYVASLIEALGIKPENVFIVPGNHDTDRQRVKNKSVSNKKQYVDENIAKNYAASKTITEKDLLALKDSMHYYEEFINGLKNVNINVNHCIGKHEFCAKDDFDVMLLNTALTSCEKGEKIILGENLINEVFSKRAPLEDKPLFILSHHRVEDIQSKDQTVLWNKISQQSSDVLYLCGHYHCAQAARTKGLLEIVCGTTQSTEKSGNVFFSNDASVLIGSYDRQMEEIRVYFHHYDLSTPNIRWVENRAISDMPPHYHMITFSMGSVDENAVLSDNRVTKKMVFKATSESEAHKNFFDYVLNGLPSSIHVLHSEAERISKYRNAIVELLNALVKRKPQWGCFSKYQNSIFARAGVSFSTFEEIQTAIRNEFNNYTTSSSKLHNSDNLNKFTSKLKGSDKIGILLYSKSTQVTEFLKSLDIDFRKCCELYVCSGDARSKDNGTYEDALNIAQELFDKTSKSFSGYNKVSLIPDIYINALFELHKVNAVVFGAHKIFYSHCGYTHFSNTIGSGLVYKLAKEHNIPCFVIADNSKASSVTHRVEKNDEHYEHLCIIEPQKLICNITDMLNCLTIEYFDSEIIITENDANTVFLSDGSPWENQEVLTPDLYNLFIKGILKDKRGLTVKNDKTEIVKEYISTAEGKVETDIIKTLNKMGIKNSPHFLTSDGDKSLTLKYYKGIRVFNFLVVLDKLRVQMVGSIQKEKKLNELNNISTLLLKKCEDNQRILQEILFKEKNNFRGLSVYPFDKLEDMIKLLSLCFKIDSLTQEKVLGELNVLFKSYKDEAIVPFRDSSTKNMIFSHSGYFAGNFDNDWEEKQLLKIWEDFEMGNLLDIVEKTTVIDIDFSSCINLTTFSDDYISFKFHERTHGYYDWKEINLWNSHSESPKSILVTFIIRFLRFGGRKALYRIMDNKHHVKRFKYDDELYYFSELIRIIQFYVEKNVVSDTDIHNTLLMLANIKDAILKNKNATIIPSGSTIEDKKMLEEIYKNEKRVTYIDLYPY